MTLFVIGQRDDGRLTLKPIGHEIICLDEGQMVFVGASSDPDLAIIGKTTGEIIEYYKWPFKKPLRLRIPEMRNLARTGTQTKLAHIKAHAMQYETWRAIAADLENALQDKPGRKHDPVDHQPVYALIRCTDPGVSDPWSEYEQHNPHSVSGMNTETGIMEVSCARGDALEMMLTMPEGFEFVGCKERE